MGEWIGLKEELDNTYKYMLKYTMEGVQDPERQKVYKKLVSRIYDLADMVKEHLLTIESIDYTYVQKRIFRDELLERPVLENELRKDLLSGSLREDPYAYEKEMSFWFRYFWLSDKYREQQNTLMNTILLSEYLSAEEKAVFVSSLNLSLMRYFDSRKFDLLFKFFEQDDEELKQRALTGILLAFYQYDGRLSYYPEIRNRLLVLDEDPQFKKLVEEVIIQLIRSKDTEKLTKRMQQEILPEMIKFTPQLRKKLDLDKLLKESLGEDQNPEWEKILDDTPELKGKMEELTELQMEGSDVFMSSFSMLKNFPFFSSLSNWFYPYTKEHPAVKEIAGRNKEDWFNTFLGAVSESAFLCNSDKYSFCFGIQNMPDDMKHFLSDGLKAEADQMEEILKDEEMINPIKKSRKVIRQYIQDLYRFYKLHPEKKDFGDIFSRPLDFHNKSFFKDLFVDDTKILYSIAGFYFEKKYFSEAAEVYRILESMGDVSAEVLQKMGYAYQKQEMYQEALDCYLKADIILPENAWNLKKIGLCYRYLKQPAKALPYFRQADYQDPENLHTETSIAHCLLDMQEYEGALKSYFKVEYLNPGNHKVWRPIAWCSFLLGKFDQSKKYYNKLQEAGSNPFDIMNLGHVEWCLGDRQKAIEKYRESIVSGEMGLEAFLESFEEDWKHLIEHGVDPDDIPIVLDHLRYLLEE
jgi:tetratricopeptide (TPR) repeat protein